MDLGLGRGRVQLGEIGLSRCEGQRAELWGSRAGDREGKAVGEIMENSVTFCLRKSVRVTHSGTAWLAQTLPLNNFLWVSPPN